MSAKAFKISKWLAFGISCITTAFFLIKTGGKQTPPELRPFLWILGGIIAWLFNSAEQGLLGRYLIPLLKGDRTWSKEEIPVFALPLIFGLDAATTRSGLLFAGLGQAVSWTAGLTLPWLFELFADLEKRASELEKHAQE